jgi:hypothetical protein
MLINCKAGYRAKTPDFSLIVISKAIVVNIEQTGTASGHYFEKHPDPCRCPMPQYNRLKRQLMESLDPIKKIYSPFNSAHQFCTIPWKAKKLSGDVLGASARSSYE